MHVHLLSLVPRPSVWHVLHWQSGNETNISHQVHSYHGRDLRTRDTLHWENELSPPVSVHLITGPHTWCKQLLRALGRLTRVGWTCLCFSLGVLAQDPCMRRWRWWNWVISVDLAHNYFQTDGRQPILAKSPPPLPSPLSSLLVLQVTES